MQNGIVGGADLESWLLTLNNLETDLYCLYYYFEHVFAQNFYYIRFNIKGYVNQNKSEETKSANHNNFLHYCLNIWKRDILYKRTYINIYTKSKKLHFITELGKIWPIYFP